MSFMLPDGATREVANRWHAYNRLCDAVHRVTNAARRLDRTQTIALAREIEVIADRLEVSK